MCEGRTSGGVRSSHHIATARRENGSGFGGGMAADSSESLWFASNPSKRWGEAFFLLYTPFWLTLCLGIIVPYRLYERFTELEYLIIGLVSSVPAFLIPLLIMGKADSCKCWRDRYWVKVPHTTFFLTHSCFLFYHMTSNITLRRLRHVIADFPQSIRLASEAAWILALSYFIAYLETLAISNFPYYEFVNRESMYKVGSLFYAIYFIVSFPMFLRVDEKEDEPWDLPRVAVDALGAAMLVTIILDLWRIFLGPIVPIPESRQCSQPGLAWFHIPQSSMNM
ncbi:cycloeucalenol cycloisomerase-like isoform X2 [Musa acuminata AAA Group]|uniref:cycloeucalenol cycloisomerase-like isoform X2 n=1 Tax=Musa acuminata AAA Group TaxID=214697 RepID=UPI0031D38236